LCRYTRICPKFRTVYLLSTVVKLTWKHGEINPSQKKFFKKNRRFNISNHSVCL
jgi:hypothetical protein